MLIIKTNKKFNKDGGQVLLVTIFILGICLSVVLGVNVILLSQIKMLTGVGNSVAAFYMADSGLEMTLYANRKIKQTGGLNPVALPDGLGICSTVKSDNTLTDFMSQVDLSLLATSYSFDTKDGSNVTTCNISDCGSALTGCVIAFTTYFPAGNKSFGL